MSKQPPPAPTTSVVGPCPTVIQGVVGWCDGAGSTYSAGASYNLDTVGQGPIALAVGAGGGVWTFLLSSILLSSFSLSLGDGPI